ncbi:LCP family protein [Desulfocucumis palustris]|nr:LCP family protein [Desulfocucumis palustris]
MKNNIKKWILIILGVCLWEVAVFFGSYIYDSMNPQKVLLAQHEESQSSQSDNSSAEREHDYKNDIGATTNVINILFLGIDKTDERESWLGVYRSDTIAIARIYLDSKKIKVLNIPRDTYTYVPIANKMDKINHAFAFGSVNGNGVQASLNAVSHFFDKQIIDYYFTMNMEPIPSIVDEIGGVKLDVEIDMKNHGANLKKGLQVLNGKQAFYYIRWRYSAGGDIDRIKRQQKFISALYTQQRDSGKIIETLNIILKHKNNIQTDLNIKQLIGLAASLSDIPNGNVTYYTIPGTCKMINGISYWLPDENNTNEIIKEFLC